MTLFLRRDNSAGAARFTVYDSMGFVKYYVCSSSSGVTSRLVITASEYPGDRCAKIRRLPGINTASYILRAGKGYITLVCVLSPAAFYAKIYGKNWHISGDMRSKCFDVHDVDNTLIMRQTYKNHSSELYIEDEANEMYCVMLSVCSNLINTVEKTAVAAV